MLHTIVVPLDGSAFAEQALIPAYRIAQRLHATVELAHVFEPTLQSIYASGAPVLEPRLDRDLRAEARAYLETIAARERRSANVPVTARLLEGPVVKALADHVAGLDGALVVMTTHGRGGLARAWLGSVTDGLVRSSSVPVLAIRSRKDTSPGAAGEFRRVLVPLAEAQFGAEAIDLTIDVAGTDGVEYFLLHALAPPVVIPPPEPVIVTVPDLGEAEAAAQAFLSDLAAPLRARGIHVSTKVVVEPSPARAILEFVEENGIHLVGMATHGYRGAKRLLLGSVADKVLRSAPVPTLMIHPPEDARKPPRGAADPAAAAR